MIVFKKRIIKALIRLRRCAGWSVYAFVVRKPPKTGFLASRPSHLIEHVVVGGTVAKKEKVTEVDVQMRGRVDPRFLERGFRCVIWGKVDFLILLNFSQIYP